MNVEFISSIFNVSEHEWNSLWPSNYPFAQHAFFAALENSQSISGKFATTSGWQTHHLVVRSSIQQSGQRHHNSPHPQSNIVALMPLFIKTHSWGEYVFDWSWAEAYHQQGIPYYPKLINAIPFTPASGSRWAISSELNPVEKQQCYDFIRAALENEIRRLQLSGFHSLFPESAELFLPSQHHQRIGTQYHWFNRDYANFDDFLQKFASRKRKNLMKERRKVAEANLAITLRPACDVQSKEWDDFYHLYHNTYLKRSGRGGYLGANFFHELASALPENILLASAYDKQNLIAAALYLRDDTTLYGRYWGAACEIDGLHFECCYYQGIEYAIKHKLTRFDPGAQGEHKIQRGFTPIKTQSFHYLLHPEFNKAVGHFVQQEAKHIDAYIEEARKLLPFKEGIEWVPADYLLQDR